MTTKIAEVLPALRTRSADAQTGKPSAPCPSPCESAACLAARQAASTTQNLRRLPMPAPPSAPLAACISTESLYGARRRSWEWRLCGQVPTGRRRPRSPALDVALSVWCSALCGVPHKAELQKFAGSTAWSRASPEPTRGSREQQTLPARGNESRFLASAKLRDPAIAIACALRRLLLEKDARAVEHSTCTGRVMRMQGSGE